MIPEKEHYYSEIKYEDQPTESRSVEVLPKVDRPYANVTDDTQHASEKTERDERRTNSSDQKAAKKCSKTLEAVMITVLSCLCIGLLIGIIILATKKCAEKGTSYPVNSFFAQELNYW